MSFIVAHKEWQGNLLCIVCQKCKSILASVSEDCLEMLPEFSTCNCDEKFKVYQEGKKTIIERLVYPRFKATVIGEELLDVEEIDTIDNYVADIAFAKAKRAASEYVRKGHLRK